MLALNPVKVSIPLLPEQVDGFVGVTEVMTGTGLTVTVMAVLELSQPSAVFWLT